MSKGDLDGIIARLLAAKRKPVGSSADLTQAAVLFLCRHAKRVFLSQPVLLDLCPPLTVCGDIHGQFLDLLRLFEFFQHPPGTRYLFLGDYVDRGPQSIETVCLLFAYKIKYRDSFFLLRGNHECSLVNQQYGFFADVVQSFSVAVWRTFSDVFNCMPVAATISGKIFCVHAGISPDLRCPDDIRAISRPVEVGDSGMLCDLLWSDPNPDGSADAWEPNERGISVTYSLKHVEAFLARNGFDLICRGHQTVADGYEFPFSPHQGLVTLFSAPCYPEEVRCSGAVMMVEDDLLCKFAVIEPVDWEAELGSVGRSAAPPGAVHWPRLKFELF
jgi:serine/threonine-protein phosphatase PP1 catalytic subunit